MPAKEALIPGVSTQTKAVIPTTALDKRLKRADSHRFTVGESQIEQTKCFVWPERTTPHPVVRVRILRSENVSRYADVKKK